MIKERAVAYLNVDIAVEGMLRSLYFIKRCLWHKYNSDCESAG